MTEPQTGGSDWRAVLDRMLTEYRTRTRAIAARLSASGQARHERAHREEQDHDNDVVESWMADPRGPATREPSGTDVVDRIGRGDLTWDDVLSGRAGDRESASLRAFLAERATEIRAAREARG
jgi:hypothetical protein